MPRVQHARLTKPFGCLQRVFTLGENSGDVNNHPVSSRTPGGDPLLFPPDAGSSVDRSKLNSPVPPDSAMRRSGSQPPRRQHPARGARALALAASVVATGAVAATLAYSEGAWGADSEVIADGPADQLAGAAATVDNSSAVTSTIAADTASSTTPSTTTPSTTTPSTTAVATTTPEATQRAEVAADPSGSADGVFLGTAEDTEWGDVQVQVTISDGAIVDIAAAQYPTGRKSSSINSQAIPMLEANAIALQSADLDIVSGATYTSRTYADSMQAALDQAALAAAQETVSS
jgi:uncharacterized protein with FMN-binding domain